MFAAKVGTYLGVECTTPFDLGGFTCCVSTMWFLGSQVDPLRLQKVEGNLRKEK